MSLVLEVVTESLARGRHVTPGFTKNSRFDATWWHNGSAKSPVSYCSLREMGEEVARAKILPGSLSYSGGYTTWRCPPDGATDIDLLEVRPDLRRSGKRYGRQAVTAIEAAYGEPLIALSLNASSDRFWRSLGWRHHRHPDGERHSVLFTSC